jgi:hypothetical protein
MALSTNLNLLDPSAISDQLAIEDAKRHADLMQKMGLQQSQGQMVSGHYVNPSWTQGLANMLYLYGAKKSEDQANALTRELSGRQSQMLSKMLRLPTANDTTSQAIPQSNATPIDTTSENITPSNALALSGQGPTQATANLIGQPNPNLGQAQLAQPAQPSNIAPEETKAEKINRLKIASVIMPDNPMIKLELENELKMPDTVKEYNFAFGPQGSEALKAKLTQGMMYNAPAGSQSTNLLTGQTSFVPKTGEGQVYEGGAIKTTPGYLGSLSDITGTTEAAKKGYELVDVPMPDGTTRKMTVTQAAGLTRGNVGGQNRSVGQMNQPMGQPSVTGQSVQSNMPGIPVMSASQAKAKELDITNASEYEKALNNTISQGRNFMDRLNVSEQALDQFQPGMGAGARLQVARAAKSLGMPEDVIKGINAGDIASKQVFQKLAVQQAMEALKQDMQSGRITQAEFQIYKDNLPNIETDPAAIKQLFNVARQHHAANISEQQAYANYKKQGGDPGQWQAQWSQMKEAQRATTKPTTNLLPQDQRALEWANANPNDPRAKTIKKRLGL